jgi:hypothetical protein
MIRFTRITCILYFILFSVPAFSGIGIDSWRTHYSYNNVKQVASTGDKIYSVANGKLFSVDNEGIIETYSTLTGLSGFDISFIGWSETEKTLLIVYSDGNMDFIEGSDIHYLPDFKNKSVTSDKTVYNLRIDGRYAYLLTGVGMVVVDIRKKEIAETYCPESNGNKVTVYDAAIIGDSIFLATNEGLFKGNSKDNLLDPSKWSYKSFISGKLVKNMIYFSGKLYVLADDGLIYRQTDNGWLGLINDPNVFRLQKSGDYLFFCGINRFWIFDSNHNLINTDVFSGYDLSFDKNKQILYVAAGELGLVEMSKKGEVFSKDTSDIKPNGPSQIYAWNSFFYDGVYYSTTGGRWGDRFNTVGDILTFKDEKWNGINNKQDITAKTGVPFTDILNLAIDPLDNKHYFITSWGEGLYEFRDSVFYKLHNQYNSPLITMIPGRFCRVDGATFDKSGNLWVLNSTYGLSKVSDTTLWVLKPDGKWYGQYYSDMPSAPTWNSILFTSRKQLWINSLRVTYGVFVVDQNNTPFDASDDKTRWFSSFTDQDGKTISPYTVNCITEDLNGAIWIGTRFGPLVVSNPSSVFNSNFTFTRVIIPKSEDSNLGDYLLENIRVNCITVDGANRKWMGTEGNGLYLFSPDGLKTIHHFTTENSPLPSDYIYSVAINPETGEVFIGTDAGLVSYRSDATTGEVSYSEIHVFPNPVKPGYNGKITVKGLMENTQVRITDLNGNLIVSGTSLGGQFSWDGLNIQGNRVASGIYLVFCASEDGTQYQTCKFMVVN